MGTGASVSSGRARIFERREEKYELDDVAARWLEEQLVSRLPLFSYYPGLSSTYITTVYFDTRDHRLYWRAERDYDDNLKIRVREYYYRIGETDRLPGSNGNGKRPIAESASPPGGGARNLTESLCYVELKQRNHGQVLKKRFAIPKTDLTSLLAGDEVWQVLLATNPPEEHGPLGDAYRTLRRYLSQYPIEVTSIVNYRRTVYQENESDLRVTLDDRVSVYAPFPGLYTVADALTREQLGDPLRESDRIILEIKCPGEYPPWLRDVLHTFSAKRLSKFTTSVRLLLGESGTVEEAREARGADALRKRAPGEPNRAPGHGGPGNS